jgi:sirohydrochlorin ferrochelatase
VRALAAKVSATEHAYHDVSCAFLELAEPLIPDGVEQAILRGAKEVVVMPYFLSAGRHVVSDIPAEVAKVSGRYPHIEVKIAPYLGAAEQMTDIILRQSEQ